MGKVYYRILDGRPVAILLTLIGLSGLVSIALINPWVARYWHPKPLSDVSDVLLSYVGWSATTGVALLLFAMLVARARSESLDNFGLLVASVAALVLCDRLLLAYLGLPLWIHDPDLHYRHRPNAIRSWGAEYDDKPIRINAYGYHDDDFPVSKNPGEFRAVTLGDSVTMGHGVTAAETYANRLEDMIDAAKTGVASSQIINAGVQGYATFQEYAIFKQSLAFDLDFVTIGFVLNDVTEPFLVNRRFGGTGVDTTA